MKTAVLFTVLFFVVFRRLLAVHLSVGRENIAIVAVNNYVLFAGGKNTTGPADVVDVWDLNTNKMTKAILSSPRTELAGTAVGKVALFAGGATISNVVEIFNSDSKTWTITTLSQPRSYITATSVGKFAIFAGGVASIGISAVVDIFDSSSAVWNSSLLSQPRARLSSVSVGKFSYFVGGDSGLIETFDSTLQTWNTSSFVEAYSKVVSLSSGKYAIVATGDTYYNYTSILLRMDGTVSNTVFKDSGPNNFTVNNCATTLISNTQYKYGQSALLDGTGSCLYVSHATAFDLPGDFTVEGWYYFLQVNQYNGFSTLWAMDLLDRFQLATTANGLEFYFNGALFLTYPVSVVAGGPLINQWNHFAVTRTGTNVTIWMNGQSVKWGTSAASINVGGFYIGKQVNNAAWYGYFKGYVDDFRFIKGVSVYNSNFTPSKISTFALNIIDSETNAISSVNSGTPGVILAATSVGNLSFFAGSSNVLSVLNSNTFSWTTATLSSGRKITSAGSVGSKFAIFTGGTESTAIDIWENECIFGWVSNPYKCGKAANTACEISIDSTDNSEMFIRCNFE